VEGLDLEDLTRAPWTPERAQAWEHARSWRVGCNFVPSSASNPIEMWRAETFDLPTIERELDWSASLGFTSHRVFLHDLVWDEDASGLLDRIDVFLEAAARRGLEILPVLFDGVWNPHPRSGPQPEPKARVHNAGWVQGPGAAVLSDPARQDAMEDYVCGVLDRFRDDARIDGWDLFNEPDNPNLAYAKVEIPDKTERALELACKTLAWARAVDPSQPLTIGVYRGGWAEGEDDYSELNRVSLENSDVISFHWYGPLDEMARRVEQLRRFERPIRCTEFMARGMGSRFDPQLGWLRDAGIGAYCWGFVQGRIQTEYPWDSWVKTYEREPDPWFHDLLRSDGSPYREEEVEYIRSLAR
jgi:hypothetical protein